MRKSLGSILSLTGALTLIVPMAVSAQDYFREYGTSRSSGGFGPVWPSDYTYRDASPSGLAPLDPTAAAQKAGDRENFAIGPVRFAMAAGLGVEFNDNITYAETGRQSDVILTPVFNIDAMLPLSEMNTLRFSVGLSYNKYLDHSQYDTHGVLISPNSALELNVMLGQVKLVFRDRFSYQEDPYDIPELSGVARYDRYENQAGLEATYDLNSGAGFSAGYDHYNLWTKGSTFSDEDRAVDTLFVKPFYHVTEKLKVGINASYSFINFESSDRADGHSLLVGPYLEYQINENTNAYLEVGYQSLQYDGSFTPTNLIDQLSLTSAEKRQLLAAGSTSDDEGSDSYYIRAEIDNKPFSTFQHRLSFSKTAEIGFFDDFYNLYHVEYDAEFTGINHVSIGPSIFYEYYDSSGGLSEKANRVGATIGIRYYMNNSLTLGLDYRYLWKDSNLPGADYYQNLVFLSAYYKF
jgi:hypothetical protein